MSTPKKVSPGADAAAQIANPTQPAIVVGDETGAPRAEGAAGPDLAARAEARAEAERSRAAREALAGKPTAPPVNPVSEDGEVDLAAWMEGRPRVPFGNRRPKLEYPERPGFHRHWFNDRPGRIDSARAAGYKHVNAAGSTIPVSRVVDRHDDGKPMLAYLMEIPMQFYLEDIAYRAAEDDKIDAAIRGGRIQAKPGGNRYVPRDGIKIGS